MKKKLRIKHTSVITLVIFLALQLILIPYCQVIYAQDAVSATTVPTAETTPRSSSKVVTRLYIASSNQTGILRENGENKLLIKDYLGSTRLIDDHSESALKELQTFYPYGESVGEDLLIDKTDKGFTGHRLVDESGIYQADARFYSPELGRFIQPDKKEPGNKYNYAHNNPVQFNDPEGEVAHWVIGAAVGAVIGGVIATRHEYKSQMNQYGHVESPGRLIFRGVIGAAAGGVMGVIAVTVFPAVIAAAHTGVAIGTTAHATTLAAGGGGLAAAGAGLSQGINAFGTTCLLTTGCAFAAQTAISETIKSASGGTGLPAGTVLPSVGSAKLIGGPFAYFGGFGYKVAKAEIYNKPSILDVTSWDEAPLTRPRPVYVAKLPSTLNYCTLEELNRGAPAQYSTTSTRTRNDASRNRKNNYRYYYDINKTTSGPYDKGTSTYAL